MAVTLKPGWLYFLGEENFQTGKRTQYVKVGKTDGDRPVSERMSDHQTGNPRRIIELVPSIRTHFIDTLETHMHHQFACNRIHGEWFEFSPSELRGAVKEAERVNGEMNAIRVKAARVAAASKRDSNGRVKRASATSKKIHADFIAIEKARWMKKYEKESVELELRRLTGSTPGIDGVSVQMMPSPRTSFDKQGLEDTRPALYKKFLRNVNEFSKSFAVNGKPTRAKADVGAYAALKTKKAASTAVTSVSGSIKRRSASAKKWHERWLELHSEIAGLNWESERLTIELKSLCGDSDGIDGVCSWKRVTKTKLAFDGAAFKDKHPQIYRRYLKKGKASVKFSVNDKRPY